MVHTKNKKRDELILEHLPVVRAIALRLQEGLPKYIELDDLVHAGVLGLIDAASKFKRDKNVDFRSYARHRIRGSILDSLRELDWRSRDVRRQQKAVSECVRVLSQKLKREPLQSEIADHLGITIEKWTIIRANLEQAGPVSVTPSEDGAPQTQIADSGTTLPDQTCALSELKSALETAKSCLPERYRMVIDLYYTSEKTMADIGVALGVNESRVSQIHKTALEKLGAALRDSGVRGSAAFDVATRNSAALARGAAA